MEKIGDFYTFMVTLLLQTGFVKKGGILPQYNELGVQTGYKISVEPKCDDTEMVCPYCGGSDNLHTLRDSGRAFESINPETGEVMEIEVNGYRCCMCARFWVMFVSNNGYCIQVGVNQSKTN